MSAAAAFLDDDEVSPKERLAELFEQIAELTGQRNAIDAQIVDIVAEIDHGGLAGMTGARSISALVAWKTGVSPRNAKTIAAVAARGEQFPRCVAGLREGRLSLDQVGVLAERAADGSDDHYVELASVATVTQLRKAVGLEPRPDVSPKPQPERAVSRTDHGESVTYRITVSKIEAAKVDAALAGKRDGLIADWKRDRDQDPDATPDADGLHGESPADADHLEDSPVADAEDVEDSPVADADGVGGDFTDHADFADLSDGPDSADSENARRAPMPNSVDAFVELIATGWDDEVARRPHAQHTTVVVHVDVDKQVGALHLGPLLTDAERQYLSCDATCEVWFERAGRPIGAGRSTRTVNRRLRRALEHRDRCCVVPGCGATRGLHAHHLRHWENGGLTELENLVLVCPYHHRLHHAGGITLTGPAHQLVVTDADGQALTNASLARPPTQPPPAVAPCKGPTGERADWWWYEPFQPEPPPRN
ncbi:HNH endonuclease signature motif containing protein [Mycolicibacterium sp. OfavD-34-C]|uniref:HNH endonuclease signature motif containing protein n=1 Tax=Mycolicibacterium sp. OfavD-34-C TaxID=2917746 RepID=UPI001EF6D876|nr:HNH endonuclease signature motif containing protein [Mycolicibacterium sp. OfavD-34-C]MCG7579031.1 HNH endonuclease [Mycolicibacterium sp. OfavD-34-C]